MIKLCDISICKTIEIIFQNCLRLGRFPSECKKANVVPTFKKGDKQCIKNYRPISLLPVCSKVFERLLYNSMLSFFSENDLISLKSLVLDQVVLAPTGHYQLHAKFVGHLMTVMK